MRPRYLILAGTLTFLAGILIQAPAALIYAWIAPKAQMPVRLIGISGTLTHGKALQARYGNQVLIADVDWTLRPLNLLLAQLSYQLHSGSPPLMIDGTVSQGFAGIDFNQLTANGELRTLAAAAGQNFVPVNGAVSLNLASLQLRNNWPVSAEGSLQINNLEWILSKEPAPLGNYQILLSTEDDQIAARISSLSGSVDISGEAQLKPDRSYAYALKLKPRSDAPPIIANLMKQLGNPDGNGYYTLQASGGIQQPQAVETRRGTLAPMPSPPSYPSKRNDSPEEKKRREKEDLIFGS